MESVFDSCKLPDINVNTTIYIFLNNTVNSMVMPYYRYVKRIFKIKISTQTLQHHIAHIVLFPKHFKLCYVIALQRKSIF